MDDPTEAHNHDHHHAHDLTTVGVAVLTISSSRTLSDDASGDRIEAAITEHQSCTLAARERVPDAVTPLERQLETFVSTEAVDAVITTGGTGISPDDITIEVLTDRYDKHLPGFGELFRSLSYDDIGTRVIGTRATAGVINTTPVFALPGSPDAVTLGVRELILPELSHIAGLAQRSD